MLVGNDGMNTETIHQLLLANQYSVRIADSSQRALACCKEKVPDLILINVGIPQIEGFFVCKYLRHQYNSQELPILFLTAKNQE